MMHGGYHYFMHVYMLAIIQWMCWVSMKYWHKYYMLKLLSSLSCSNASIVMHIIKTSFNNTSSIVQVLLLQVSWIHS